MLDWVTDVFCCLLLMFAIMLKVLLFQIEIRRFMWIICWLLLPLDKIALLRSYIEQPLTTRLQTPNYYFFLTSELNRHFGRLIHQNLSVSKQCYERWIIFNTKIYWAEHFSVFLCVTLNPLKAYRVKIKPFHLHDENIYIDLYIYINQFNDQLPPERITDLN